jgi:fatty-acyl-CoA synthase
VSGEHVIGRWLRDRAALTPHRTAIEFEGETVSYAELDRRSESVAAELLASGARRGDRIASLTANSPEHVVLFFACAKAGLILMPLNWRLAAPELAYQLDDAEPAFLFVERDQAEAAKAALAAAAVAEPVLRDLTALDAPAADAQRSEVADDDGLLLVYTSGTTGKPKGALLTHANCFWTNLSFDLSTGLAGDDVVLQVLPQFHCGGWNVQPLLAWWKGATVVLERSFDAARVLRLIEERRVTTMMGVPAIYLFLAQEPGFSDADLSSLRRAVVGGAPMPESLLETWAGRGTAILQGYGLTEAAPNVLCLPAEDAVRKLGYAGKPYPHVEVALRAESGELLAGAGSGELVVRGPNVFAGYWRNDEATRAALVDGWLRTGDVAERDAEGYYRIRGRLKELYISGGENVYPAEIEAVLHEHPGVADAAVAGVPDERWGEAGIAFVVAAEGVALEADDLRAFCAERLARYKLPREFHLVAELPRSGAGKVLKAGLLAAHDSEGAPA